MKKTCIVYNNSIFQDFLQQEHRLLGFNFKNATFAKGAIRPRLKRMEGQKNTERLAGLVIKLAGAAIITALCWYFRSTLIYIVLAAVVSLICRPIARGMKKIRINGKSAPDWFIAIVSLLLFMLILVGIITQIVPVVSSIVQSVSENLQSSSLDASTPARWADKANLWIIDRFPKVGRDFRIQDALVNWAANAFDISSITSVVGSFASAIGSLGIGLFSVIFIGFFLSRMNLCSEESSEQ
jgi:Predicted permease